MATPHNQAGAQEIAKVVLMPGDPLRAQFIAKEYLQQPSCFNEVRGMLGYTGLYQGTRLSVMGSGMGMPSMGIYSYELFHMYSVEAIIRIGSAGAISDRVHLKDLVIGMGASTDSAYAAQYELPGTLAPLADYALLRMAADSAQKRGLPYHVGGLVSSDIFYEQRPQVNARWADMGMLAVEMETAALYMNAAKAGKRALAICTISDHLLMGEKLDSQERQTGLRQMIELSLEVAAQLAADQSA